MAPRRLPPPPPGASTTTSVKWNGIWRHPQARKGYYPLWVKRVSDGPEECYLVRWSDKSESLADEDEIRDQAGDRDDLGRVGRQERGIARVMGVPFIDMDESRDLAGAFDEAADVVLPVSFPSSFHQ